MFMRASVSTRALVCCVLGEHDTQLIDTDVEIAIRMWQKYSGRFCPLFILPRRDSLLGIKLFSLAMRKGCMLSNIALSSFLGDKQNENTDFYFRNE